MADILRRLWLLSLGMKKNLSDSNRLTRVAAAVVLWILSFIVSKSPLKIIFRLLGTVLGVSGAVHHTSGIQGAGTIVAVCDDSEAPIFEMADFGVVGDVTEVVPQLVEELARLRG